MAMPQVNVTVPAPLHRLLVKVAAESGKSISSLAAECIEIGLEKKIESANQRAEFLSMEEKRQRQRALVEEEVD